MSEVELLSSIFASMNRGWHIRPEELLPSWTTTVGKCEARYDLGVDEYANDLNVREIIQEILDADLRLGVVEFRRQVEELDARFMLATRPVNRRLLAHAEDPDARTVFFYYYRIPRRYGDEFAEDLVRQGFTPAVG